MTLFTKTLEECVTEFDRLFYIFRNSGDFQKIPEWIDKSGGISRRLAQACEVAAFDKVKRLKYEINKMNERDILAQRVFAERKGFEAGYADGEAEGKAEGKAEVAKAMLLGGMTKDLVIGGLIRGSESYIAIGSTRIEPYDRVVVFALPHTVKDIDRLFR